MIVPADLLAQASARYSVQPESLLAHGRTPTVVAARRWLWAQLHGLGWSLSEIGRATGHEHSTVLIGIRKHREAGTWAN